MSGIIRVHDGVIPTDSIDSIKFRKFEDYEEIAIYTKGGKEYYVRTPVLKEDEEETIAMLIFDTEDYIDLVKLVKDLINSREVSINGEHKHT